MKIFKLSIVVALLTIKSVLQAQSIGQITSLHLFLQNNADSTLIYKKESNWIAPPVYLIISKKEDTISLYTYNSLYKKIKAPSSILDTISKIKNYPNYLQSYNVGINKFFDAKYIDDTSAIELWTLLNQQKPWQIGDDKSDGTACKDYTEEKYISDLGGISLFLITKSEIKALYFYGPQYFEEKVCPTRPGRKAVLEIEKLFLKTFKE